jgi:hypothetical protein
MLTSTKTIAMNKDILLHWIERGIFVFVQNVWTEDMKRQSRIFALVQYVRLTNKYITCKMGGTMRSVGGTQNV